MVWILLILVALFFGPEICYSFTRWSSQMPDVLKGSDVSQVEGILNKRITVFVVDSLSAEALSFRLFFQQRVLIRANLWNSLGPEGRQNLLMWLSLASSSQNFWMRLIYGPQTHRTDRDLCLLSPASHDWAASLKVIYENRAAYPPTLWGSLLAGLTSLGPGYLQPMMDLGQRLKSLAQQLTKLQK